MPDANKIDMVSTDFTDAVLSGAKNPAGCRPARHRIPAVEMLRLRLNSVNPCKSVSTPILPEPNNIIDCRPDFADRKLKIDNCR
jgi:hypothetical protein